MGVSVVILTLLILALFVLLVKQKRDIDKQNDEIKNLRILKESPWSFSEAKVEELEKKYSSAEFLQKSKKPEQVKQDRPVTKSDATKWILAMIKANYLYLFIAVATIIILITLAGQSCNPTTSKTTNTQNNAVNETPSSQQQSDSTQSNKPVEKKLTVTFDFNGGRTLPASKDTREVSYGKPFGEMPTAERNNYNFLGWFTSKTGGNRITPNTVVDFDHDITLFAQWEEIKPVKEKIVITYDTNGGKLVASADDVQVVDCGKPFGEMPTAEREMHSFLGWYTKRIGGEEITSNTVVEFENDIILYAQWKEKKTVWLADLNQYEWTGDSKAWQILRKPGNGFTDNHGVVHTNGAVGYIPSLSTSPVSNSSPSTVTYKINGEYKTVTGLVAKNEREGFVRKYMTSGGTEPVMISVYGDGQLLWSSPYMIEGIRNIEFTIDISGVDYLTFERVGSFPDDREAVAIVSVMLIE